VHPSLRQTRLNRYVRQNAQASMDPATTNMYGRRGCHRAIDTAPETPSNATDQGPMQHRPTMEANMLKPTEPPPDAMIFFVSNMYLSLAGAPHGVLVHEIRGEGAQRDRELERLARSLRRSRDGRWPQGQW
jgi:hypothetical protein